MRINEDFLDDSRIEDVDSHEDNTVQSNSDEFPWLLTIFIYIEDGCWNMQEFIRMCRKDIESATERCPSISNYLLRVDNSNINRVTFELYFNNNIKTLDSFFRFVHPLTKALWKNFRKQAQSDDEHIDYTLYKYDNGEFRTYMGGEKFSQLCDPDLLKRNYTEFYDYYRIARELFKTGATYPTLTKCCTPLYYIETLFNKIAIHFEQEKQEIGDLRFNTSKLNKNFYGDQIQTDLKDVHLKNMSEHFKDKNVYLYSCDAIHYPDRRIADDYYINYVKENMNSLEGFEPMIYGYNRIMDEVAIYFYLGCPFIMNCNCHLVLEIDIPLVGRDIVHVWERYFQEPVLLTLLSICKI